MRSVPLPWRDCSLLDFLVPDNEHVRDFLHLGFTNFIAQLLASRIDLHANTPAPQLLADRLSKIELRVGNGNDHRLHRRQPDRESPCVMFNEDPQKALNGPEDHAVYHDRPVPGPIRPYVSQIESFGQRKITLDGSALPAAVKGVFELDVDLRPVESAFPFANMVLESLFFKRLHECPGRSLPVFVRANGLLGPGADFHLEVESEDPHHVDNKIQECP